MHLVWYWTQKLKNEAEKQYRPAENKTLQLKSKAQ